MAGKEEDIQEKPEALLVHAVEGENKDRQGDREKQVPESGGRSQAAGLVAGLYGLGAEVVLTLTDAQKLTYTVQFKGETQTLELVLPAGHYVLCRITEPLFDTPGLRPVVNPRKAA